MYRRLAWGLLPLLMVAANRPDPKLAAYQRFSSGPPVSPFPAPEPEKPKAKPAEPEVKRPTDTSVALRAQEEANLLRRLAVCDKLKQVALETGDTKLEDQALKAEQRATDVYKSRIANLPTGPVAAKPQGAKP